MVLAKGQTHRPMKQARQSRNKPHKYGQFLTKAQQRKGSLFTKWYYIYKTKKPWHTSYFIQKLKGIMDLI